MFQTAIEGLTGQIIPDNMNRQNIEKFKPLQPIVLNKPVTQGGHIDIQGMINGVFTGNKNENNLPKGYLGV